MNHHMLRFTSPLRRRIAACTVAIGATLATGMAFAQSTPGAVMAGELAGVPADLGALIIALAVVVVLILTWRYSKKVT